MGYFCNTIYCRELSQSGHTGPPTPPPLSGVKKNISESFLSSMSLTDGSDNERSRNHFVTDTQTHFSYDDDDDR